MFCRQSQSTFISYNLRIFTRIYFQPEKSKKKKRINSHPKPEKNILSKKECMNCFFDFMDLYVCHFYWRFFFLYVNILGLIRKYKWNNDFLLKMKENKIKLLQSFLFFQLERGKRLHCGHGHVPAKAFRHRVGNNLLILGELISFV